MRAARGGRSVNDIDQGSKPTSIQSVEFSPLTVRLNEPFGIAGGSQAEATNVLVTVTLCDGTVGYGEAAPLPAYNGETQAGTLATLGAIAPSLVGFDALAWREIARRLRDETTKAGAVRCAVETALLDAVMKRARLSMGSFFGGTGDSLETDVTITTGSEDAAVAAATRWSEAGFRKLKIKIGAGEIGTDIARIIAVNRAAPAAELTLDANASLTAEAAIALLSELKQHGIEIALFEQPTSVGAWDELARVARHVAVAADENVVTAADAIRAAELGPPHAINVKIMKAGIVEALDVIAVARASGMSLMIGGMVESLLAMTVSAHLAAGSGGFTHVDLDTPLFFAENPMQGGFSQRGPLLLLPSSPGHGVVPNGVRTN